MVNKEIRKTCRFLRQISRHLLPNCCILCGCRCDNNGDTGRDICTDCHNNLPWNRTACQCCALPLPDNKSNLLCGQCQQLPPAFDRVVAPLRYEFPVDRLINRFKHQHSLSCGVALTGILMETLTNTQVQLSTVDVIVPVPLHWRRQFKRGFNQADWLAARLSKKLHIPLQRKILARVLPTPAQQGLTRKERLANLRQAFRLDQPVAGKRVALVDDVVTTGSTANTLAALLKKSDATEVQIWCLARTPKNRS